MHTHMGKIVDPVIRSLKYKCCRDNDLSIDHAVRMRDWTWNHIKLFIESNPQLCSKVTIGCPKEFRISLTSSSENII